MKTALFVLDLNNHRREGKGKYGVGFVCFANYISFIFLIVLKDWSIGSAMTLTGLVS